MNEVLCQYCDSPAVWVENKTVYGRNYGKSYMIWYCPKCEAYVGCHNNTKKPLGTMANKELRAIRTLAHQSIDPLWKINHMPRKNVYKILRKIFGYEIHIGSADIETCRRIIEVGTQLQSEKEYKRQSHD